MLPIYVTLSYFSFNSHLLSFSPHHHHPNPLITVLFCSISVSYTGPSFFSLLVLPSSVLPSSVLPSTFCYLSLPPLISLLCAPPLPPFTSRPCHSFYIVEEPDFRGYYFHTWHGCHSSYAEPFLSTVHSAVY